MTAVAESGKLGEWVRSRAERDSEPIPPKKSTRPRPGRPAGNISFKRWRLFRRPAVFALWAVLEHQLGVQLSATPNPFPQKVGFWGNGLPHSPPDTFPRLQDFPQIRRARGSIQTPPQRDSQLISPLSLPGRPLDSHTYPL